MFFNKARRADASNDSTDAYTLAEAAAAVLENARRETLALAHVAEQSGRPQYWFAANMLTVIAVEGLGADAAAAIVLTRALIADLTLADDMMALISAGEGHPIYTGLTVRAAELARYLAWARTVY